MKKYKHFIQQYRTGQTKPPRSYGGIIALLLILVIFLSGIISILSMLNIHLLTYIKDNNKENIPMLRTQTQHNPQPAAQIPENNDHWGMTCHTVTDFHARYYHIPQGIYISRVAQDSPMKTYGVQAGDIITHLNNTPISDRQSFVDQITELPDQPAVLTLKRNNESIQLTISPKEVKLWN